MKLSLKGGDNSEHVRVSNDSRCGFLVDIGVDYIHIRAKSPNEPDADKTTLVLETNCEVSK